MIVGAYTMDLYCDNAGGYPDGIHTWEDYSNMPHQYVAETRQECFAAARRDGWLLNRMLGKALCPRCSGKQNSKETLYKKGGEK